MVKRVLVVEDDPDILMAVTDAMEEEGYEVSAALDISVAEALLRDGMPEIAIIDHGLPDGTGDELAARMSEVGETIIIMYTAQAAREIVELSISSGAVDYVLKGTGIDELISRVNKHVASAA